MEFRQARRSDHIAIKEVIPSWWSGSHSPEQARELAMLVPPLFLQHFATTSWVAEEGDALAGFVIGFHSADQPDEAYIHFIGVDPRLRGKGLARSLYTRFFHTARAAGRAVVRAITSPQNTGSIAFHRAVGFEITPGDKLAEGVSVHSDYDGPGLDRVCFVTYLDG